MSPVFPTLNSANVGLGDAKHSSNLSLFKIALLGKFPNFYHIALCKLCAWMVFPFIRHEANRMGVTHIFAPGNIFKVIQSIVRRVAVFMVDFKTLWTRTKEGGCYNLLNRGVNITGHIAKTDVISSNCVRAVCVPPRRFQHISWPSSKTRSIPSNSTKIGNRVDFFIANDWFPNFPTIHTKSLPHFVTGYKGLLR